MKSLEESESDEEREGQKRVINRMMGKTGQMSFLPPSHLNSIIPFLNLLCLKTTLHSCVRYKNTFFHGEAFNRRDNVKFIKWRERGGRLREGEWRYTLIENKLFCSHWTVQIGAVSQSHWMPFEGSWKKGKKMVELSQELRRNYCWNTLQFNSERWERERVFYHKLSFLAYSTCNPTLILSHYFYSRTTSTSDALIQSSSHHIKQYNNFLNIISVNILRFHSLPSIYQLNSRTALHFDNLFRLYNLFPHSRS